MEFIVTTQERLEEIIETAVARTVFNLSGTPAKKEKSNLDIEEAIELLTERGYRVSKSLIYSLTYRKLIPFKKFGGTLMFEKEELLSWAQRRASRDHGADAIKQISKSAQRRLIGKN